MYSFVIGAYIVILVIEAILFLLAWSQTRVAGSLIGSLLAVATFLLLLTPDSTLAAWIVRIFPGQSALSAASMLFPRSLTGSITYGLVIVALALIAQPWRWGGKNAKAGGAKPSGRKHR
ncbi:MAG: hypothetical protein ACYC5Y_01180 [Symbiobacteriia bacterium]